MAIIVLDPHTRGDTFVYSTTLLGGWTAEQFTGGMRFTVRRTIPPSTELTDTAAVASVTTASGAIVAIGTSVTVTIPASVTKLWPARKLYFDLRGIVTVVPENIEHTVSRGTIIIEPDISRS